MTGKAQEAKKVSPEAEVEVKEETKLTFLPGEYVGDPLYKESYWWVRFHEKRSKEEPDDVTLTVSDYQLVVPRGVETILPARFLENADHTTFEHYDQQPGKDRMVAGTIKRYPYDKLRKATYEEYMKLKEEGTKKAREDATSKQG